MSLDFQIKKSINRKQTVIFFIYKDYKHKSNTQMVIIIAIQWQYNDTKAIFYCGNNFALKHFGTKTISSFICVLLLQRETVILIRFFLKINRYYVKKDQNRGITSLEFGLATCYSSISLVVSVKPTLEQQGTLHLTSL